MRPPRLVQWLLAMALPAANRADVLGELEREFRIECSHRGHVPAARWYRRQAVRSLPSALVMRLERTMIVLEQVWLDARYALRALSHAKLFTVVAAVALGVGIGGGAMTFTAVDAFFLKPLPFERPDALVHVWATDRQRGRLEMRSSLPEFEAWVASGVLESAALFNYTSEELSAGGDPERVPAGRVSANAFDVLGVRAAIGRTFQSGDDVPGAAPGVIVSHQFWQTRMGARSDVLAQSLDVGGVRRRVIGVMPSSFVFPLPITQLWLPYSLDRARYTADVQPFQIVARLKPGMTMSRATEALAPASARLAETNPALMGRSANVTALREALNFAHDMFAIGSLVVGLANVLLLLTAATNVSGLLLGRALRRGREVSIRAAVGASRMRLVRQFAVESLLLGLAGGVAGTAWAMGGVALMNRVIPDNLYRAAPFQFDMRAAGIVLLLSMAATLIFGLAPALRLARVDLSAAMRQDGGTATTAQANLRLQGAIIVTQVALTIVLLVGTLLITRSFTALSRVPPGFDAAGVLSVQTILPRTRYDTDQHLRAFQTAALERVGQATAGTVAMVNHLPLNHEADERQYDIPGQTVDSDRPRPSAWAVMVSPAYFDVMRIPTRGGRLFSDDDRAGRSPVVVINESMARRHWPSGDAVGSSILVRGRTTPATVIGIVADTKHWDLAETGKAQVYFPLAQEPTTYLRVLVRVSGDPTRAVPAVVKAIHQVDPVLPVTEIQPLGRVVDEFLLPQRSLRTTLAVSGTFSLGLAILGIYGIVACFVNERTRELAIRSALGASPAAIIRLVTGRSLRLVLRGAAVGVPLAVAAAYALRGLLFGVGAGDPVTYLFVAALVVGVALLAAVLPARRAASIDPASVIRMP